MPASLRCVMLLKHIIQNWQVASRWCSFTHELTPCEDGRRAIPALPALGKRSAASVGVRARGEAGARAATRKNARCRHVLECKATSCACGLILCWGIRVPGDECAAVAAVTGVVLATAKITAATATAIEVGDEHLGIILVLLLQGGGKVYMSHACDLCAMIFFFLD